jgi:hypothetical protein
MRILSFTLWMAILASVLSWNAFSLQTGALLGKHVEVKLKDQSVVKGTVIAEAEDAIFLKVDGRKEEVRVMRADIAEIRMREQYPSPAFWLGVIIVAVGLALVVMNVAKAG